MHLGYIQENLMENQRDNDCLFIQNYDKQKEYIECYLLLKIVVYFRDFFFLIIMLFFFLNLSLYKHYIYLLSQVKFSKLNKSM